MENLLNGKRVKMNLVGLDGNSFNLMGVFSQKGREQGFTNEEIRLVLDECMKGDYHHLIYVLVNHTEEVDEFDEDVEEFEEEEEDW